MQGTDVSAMTDLGSSSGVEKNGGERQQLLLLVLQEEPGSPQPPTASGRCE